MLHCALEADGRTDDKTGFTPMGGGGLVVGGGFFCSAGGFT